MFGEKGKFIISGGNDKSVKVWDWSKSYDAGQTSEGNDLLRSNIILRKKVSNIVCMMYLTSKIFTIFFRFVWAF